MRACKCDLCGKFYTDCKDDSKRTVNDISNVVKFSLIIPMGSEDSFYGSGGFYSGKEYDICEDCTEALDNFIKERMAKIEYDG